VIDPFSSPAVFDMSYGVLAHLLLERSEGDLVDRLRDMSDGVLDHILLEMIEGILVDLLLDMNEGVFVSPC
jgi:hypothetical protein